MFDQIVSLIKSATHEAVNAHQDVPNEKADIIAEEASHSILGDLENGLKGGSVTDILGMLSGKNSNVEANATTQQMTGNFANNLTQKLGISSATASSLGASIIPAVLSKLTGKINDPSDNSFDLQGIVNQLTGGKTAGVDLKSILDRNGDGEINLGDAMALFTGGDNADGQGQNNGGGLLDKLKGMFGA